MALWGHSLPVAGNEVREIPAAAHIPARAMNGRDRPEGRFSDGVRPSLSLIASDPRMTPRTTGNRGQPLTKMSIPQVNWARESLLSAGKTQFRMENPDLMFDSNALRIKIRRESISGPDGAQDMVSR